jgi:trimethylamine---corrinoid protein Co-methyltransferase
MNRFEILDPDGLEAIHQGTLRILDETGILLGHPLGREILAGAGARIEPERVLLPPELVEKAIAGCPRKVSIRGRDGRTVTLGDGSLHWHNLGGARDIYDQRSGLRRKATREDIRLSTRLLDALPSVTSITPLFTPCDVPGEMMSISMYRQALPYTSKPLQGPGVQTAFEVQTLVQMAEVVGPPPEILTLGISPVSPLYFPDEMVGALITAAQQGVTVTPLPCPTAGTTAPLSLAGSLAQQNAEILASIVLIQLANPGVPVVYAGRLAVMEPRTAISVWGGVELGIASAAAVQIGHRYHLPVNVYGLSTNAHVLDFQNGYERALNAVIPALAGADELSGIGEAEAGIVSSFAQIVADNEIAASIQRVLRGFSTDEKALAVEVVASVMAGSHNFIGEKHTVSFLRAGEILISGLPERRSWSEWEQSGREGLVERSQAEAERILATHEIPPLSQDQEQALVEISTAAEKRLGITD